MASHRASVAAAIVQHESAALAECNIGREQIMAQYGSLAKLPPADTNGNITGQVRALDSLREMLGLVGPQPGEKREGEGRPEPNIYVAKWMRRTGAREPEDEDEMDALMPTWQ